MDRAKTLARLRAYRKDPETYKELSYNELADLVLLVLSQVELIDQAIKEGRLDGYTPEPDKDYLSKGTALKYLTDAVNQAVSDFDNRLTQKGSVLESQVQAALERIRDGRDGIVTDEEIQRAAEIAATLIELPDVEQTVGTEITRSGLQIIDAVRLANEKWSIDDVDGLQARLEEVARYAGSMSGGTIGKQQVYGFIRQAIADGTITSGGGSAAEVTFTPAGTIGSTDVQAALEELDADIQGLSVGAGISRTVVVTSGSATVGSAAATDYVYFIAGAHTMSLPAASGNTTRYTFKNNHSAAVTIDTVGAETIDGSASIQIAPEDAVDIISDGTNYYIV